MFANARVTKASTNAGKLPIGFTDDEKISFSLCQFHEKMAELFQPHAYKVLYGGRGGVKSWSIARTLLICGAIQQERILCGREVQKSIKDSVHRLLSDQIEEIGLQSFYTITKEDIVGRNRTNFLFTGLSDHTVQSIKSFESVSKVWLEEAVNITKRSVVGY